MAHYIVVPGDAATRERAAELLRAGLWGVAEDERHGPALAAGDLALVYLAAPERELVGRVELASAVHEWTPPEARVYPGDASRGVALAHVEEWDPPVPMDAVLARIDRSEGARADFDAGVVRITANEYEIALGAGASTASARAGCSTPAAGRPEASL